LAQASGVRLEPACWTGIRPVAVVVDVNRRFTLRGYRRISDWFVWFAIERGRDRASREARLADQGG
jgi:hypothetical protein